MNEKLKLSPSKLEQFRKYYDSEFRGYITKEMVVDYFSGVSTFEAHIDFGTAYHAIIEHGPEKYFNPSTGFYEYHEEGFLDVVRLTRNEIQHAIQYRDRYPGMIHECPAEITMQVNGHEVLIPMVIDGVYGVGGHEKKTKTKDQVPVEEYERSLQWKIYTMALDAKYLQYDIFTYTKRKKETEYRVKYYDFKFFPYPGMESEIRNVIGLTIDFCKNNGLLQKIIQKK